MNPQVTHKNESNQREWTKYGLHYLRKMATMSAISSKPQARFLLIEHIENALKECGLTRSKDGTFWLDRRYYIKCIKSEPKVVIYDNHADEDAVNLFVIEVDDFVNLFERIRAFWSSTRP
jgi:hypothetical protein